MYRKEWLSSILRFALASLVAAHINQKVVVLVAQQYML